MVGGYVKDVQSMMTTNRLSKLCKKKRENIPKVQKFMGNVQSSKLHKNKQERCLGNEQET